MPTIKTLATEQGQPVDGLPARPDHDGAELWELIKDINERLRHTGDPTVRAELAWQRAAAWEQLTLLAIDAGDAPWFAAACACISEVSAQAAERIQSRRQPRLPL
jgi:hypothetical protein